MDDTSRFEGFPARLHEQRHTAESPAVRMTSTRDSSGRRHHTRAKSRLDIRAKSPRRHCAGAGGRMTVSGSCPRHTLTQDLGDFSVQGSPGSLRRTWQCPHDNVGSRGGKRDILCSDALQPAAHQIPLDGDADRLCNDEPEPNRRVIAGPANVDHRVFGADASTLSDSRPIVICANDPIGSGEHRFERRVETTRKVRCAPCDGEHQGWRDRRGCACEDGIRVPSLGDGCWVGMCACS